MLTGIRDLDYKILNKLNDKDLITFCSSSSEADNLCKDQIFWMNRILTKFPYVSLDILKKYKGDRSWSEYYIKDLRKVENIKNKTKSFKDEMVQFLTNIRVAVNDNRLDHLLILDPTKINNSYRETFIKLALSKGYNDIAEYLIKISDINWILKHASREGNLNVVKFALDHGANIHIDRDYPVKASYRRRHTDIVEYLISQGAPDPR